MTTISSEKLHQIGEFLVDPMRNLLRCGQIDFPLEPKVMKVLSVLITRAGQVVTRDELVAQVWGPNYPADEGLTRNISILRGVLRSGDAAAEYIQTIPKRGYRLALPVAVVQQEEANSRDVQQVVQQTQPPTLAVLAFDNHSGNADMNYLSDGISEEILQSVAQGTELKVIGRASSFLYRGADKAAGKVSRVLGCSHVLDGSVRGIGERLRIHAELIECESETVLWSQRFDRERIDLFELEDEIAAAVAAALRTKFAPSGDSQIDPEAHGLFLKARAQLDRQFGSTGMLDALPLYEAAVAKAPDFARAWALLAQTRAYVLRGLPNERPSEVTRASVVDAAATALRLDPNCGIAYLALNGLEAWGSYDERDAHVKGALAVAPNDPEIIMAAANLAARMGRIQEALAFGEKAYALSPMFPVAGFYCATMMDMDGRYNESRELSDELLERFPAVEYMWSTALVIAAVNSDGERLERIEKQLKRTGPIDRLQGALIISKQIQNPDRSFIAPYIAKAHEVVAKKGWVDLRVLNALYKVGACEETFELVERSSFNHVFDPHGRPPGGWTNEVMLFNQAGNYPMMRDPRFVNFCAKLGLCDYWETSGQWPDCADYEFLPYDFRAAVRDSVSG